MNENLDTTKYYWVNQGKEYPQNKNFIQAPCNDNENGHRLVSEIKRRDKILSYVKKEGGIFRILTAVNIPEVFQKDGNNWHRVKVQEEKITPISLSVIETLITNNTDFKSLKDENIPWNSNFKKTKQRRYLTNISKELFETIIKNNFNKVTLKENIFKFTDDFFQLISQKTGNSITFLEPNILKKGKLLKWINLSDEFGVGFFETWNEKAYYLILFDLYEPILELQLTRILFNNDGSITWYLRSPSTLNKELYKNQNIKLTKITEEEIERIQQQQAISDGNNYKYDNGRQVYEFALNLPNSAVLEKLFFLLKGGEILLSEEKPQPKPEKKEVITYSTDEYSTDATLREVSIRNAHYKCEYNDSHNSFKSKATQNQYMEGHHLIPMSKQDEFQHKIDISVNIFSLCPNCHKAIHYGTEDERNPIIKKLFYKRKNQLQKLIPEITLEKLLELY